LSVGVTIEYCGTTNRILDPAELVDAIRARQRGDA